MDGYMGPIQAYSGSIFDLWLIGLNICLNCEELWILLFESNGLLDFQVRGQIQMRPPHDQVKKEQWVPRDGSAAKCTGCSWRGPKLSSQHPHGS